MLIFQNTYQQQSNEKEIGHLLSKNFRFDILFVALTLAPEAIRLGNSDSVSSSKVLCKQSAIDMRRSLQPFLKSCMDGSRKPGHPDGLGYDFPYFAHLTQLNLPKSWGELFYSIKDSSAGGIKTCTTKADLGHKFIASHFPLFAQISTLYDQFLAKT